MPSIDIRINPILAVIKEQYSTNKKHKICHHSNLKNSLSKQSAISIRYVASRSEGKLKIRLERLAELVEESAKIYSS